MLNNFFQLLKGGGSVEAAEYFLTKNAVKFCKAMQRINPADGENRKTSKFSSVATGRRHVSVRTFDGPNITGRRRDNRRSTYVQDMPEDLEEQFNKRLFSLTEGYDEKSEAMRILSESCNEYV